MIYVAEAGASGPPVTHKRDFLLKASGLYATKWPWRLLFSQWIE
jgi:hypothetical protein